MKIIAFIEDSATIIKILTHIGESTEQPVPSPARGPPEWQDESYPEDKTIIDHEYPDDVPVIRL